MCIWSVRTSRRAAFVPSTGPCVPTVQSQAPTRPHSLAPPRSTASACNPTNPDLISLGPFITSPGGYTFVLARNDPSVVSSTNCLGYGGDVGSLC